MFPSSEQVLVIDVDGTICDSKPYDYVDPPPIPHAREILNKLYNEGWYIVYFTARYYRRYNGDLDKIYKEGYDELANWLKRHNFLYHEIRLGKPSGRYYVDNRAWRINNDKGETDWQALLEDIKTKDYIA